MELKLICGYDSFPTSEEALEEHNNCLFMSGGGKLYEYIPGWSYSIYDVVVLNTIHHECFGSVAFGRNNYNGIYWTTFPQMNWDDPFSYMSKESIESSIESLCKTNCLFIAESQDGVRYFAVNYLGTVAWRNASAELAKKNRLSRLQRDSNLSHFTISLPPAHYKTYIASEEWRNIRAKRLVHDHFQCVMCGSAKNLNVHHITYERLGNEEMDDLITLCKDCHAKVHANDIANKSTVR